tara:strand:- start:18319 stop:18471 length:153 start_codon:yes stop_codon:yes gene_type:complete
MGNTKQCGGGHGRGELNGKPCPRCDGLGREVDDEQSGPVSAPSSQPYKQG